MNCKTMRIANIEILKQTGEWQEVMNDDLYADIRGDEDAVASEVLARIVGCEGADYVRRLLDPEHKPLKQGGVYNQIKEWLREMFNNVRSLFAPSIRNLTYDDNGNVIPLSERFNAEKQDIRYRLGEEKKPTFYSNAEKAVEGIKQNKATAE